jgi:hypothetical protein
LPEVSNCAIQNSIQLFAFTVYKNRKQRLRRRSFAANQILVSPGGDQQTRRHRETNRLRDLLPAKHVSGFELERGRNYETNPFVMRSEIEGVCGELGIVCEAKAV